MIALYFYAQIFEAWPQMPSIRGAGTQARAIKAPESTVLYLAIEKEDTLQSLGYCLIEFIKERGRCSLPVVLHSFNHLSDEPMPLNQAQRLYEHLPHVIQSEGIASVEWTTFGWIYEVLIHDVGGRGTKGRLICPQRN